MRDTQREQEIRETIVKRPNHPFDAEDAQALLDEIDYLRGQVAAETAYASDLKRQLEAR